MNLLSFKIQRDPGFRFNLIDLILIGILSALSYGIYSMTPAGYYYLLPIYIGFTFFLFCNVFRIGNTLEPFWYIPFVLITLLFFNDPEVYWKMILGILEPLKLGLILYHIRKGPYVGIGYKSLGGDLTASSKPSPRT